jgi:hypothetical protein
VKGDIVTAAGRTKHQKGRSRKDSGADPTFSGGPDLTYPKKRPVEASGWTGGLQTKLQGIDQDPGQTPHLDLYFENPGRPLARRRFPGLFDNAHGQRHFMHQQFPQTSPDSTGLGEKRQMFGSHLEQ